MSPPCLYGTEFAEHQRRMGAPISLEGSDARTELRKARRYALSLPVVIEASSQPQAVWRNGTIQDISNRGVYFVNEGELKPGLKLGLTITLPVEVTRGREVLIHIAAKVVRIEDRSESGIRKFGVAAVIGDSGNLRSMSTDSSDCQNPTSVREIGAVKNWNF